MVITFFEIVSIIYSVPSLILMLYTLCILIEKLTNKHSGFQNEFYPFVAYRLSNDILYNILAYFFLKFPIWGFWSNFYLSHDFLAAIMYSVGAFLVSGFFVHSLVISIIRFIAVRYPTKYRKMFSQRCVTFIILGMFSYGSIIGLGSIFFKSHYTKTKTSNAIVATYADKNVAYYTFSYGIVIYNLTIIFSLFFNAASWYLIYKKRKEWKTNKSMNIIYAIYSCFTFLITCFHELYFILRVIGSYLENDNLTALASIILSYTGDIGTYGDFYFILIISSKLRKALLLPCKKLFGCNFSNTESINKTNHFTVRTRCIRI